VEHLPRLRARRRPQASPPEALRLHVHRVRRGAPAHLPMCAAQACQARRALNTLYRSSTYVEPHIYPRPIRRYSIPTSITAWTLHEYGRRVHRSRHSALRRRLGLLHRLSPAAPEKLAELLRKSFSSRRPPKLKPLKSPQDRPLPNALNSA